MIRIGTSGFAFPEWVGGFYPEGTRHGPAMLAHYARHLDTVEVNYTFRHQASEKTLATWKEAVPGDFRVTLKAHQFITHRRRLVDVSDAAGVFVSRARTLGGAFGPILFQLPPDLKADAERLESFCGSLPPDARARAAFEFRHDSWFAPDVYDILRRAGCGLVVSETEESLTAAEPTAPLVYVRLRKEDYADTALRAWAQRLRTLADSGHDVYCYVKHETDAPHFALRLKQLVRTSGSRSR